MKATKTKSEKGFAIILTTLSLTFTLLLAGLGFDVGTLYLIRAKLQGAMDAAALATVRALAQSGDMVAAKTTGTEYLTANFPSGYMGATTLSTMPLSGAITIAMIDKNGAAGAAGTTAVAKQVTVTAGVTAPLYFLRMLGQNSSTVSFTVQAKREGVLIVLVLDGSGSMQNLISGTPACTYAKNDARAFLGYSQFDPDIDRMGLVTFGGNTFTVAPTADFQSPRGTINTSNAVYTALGNFACGGNTNTVEGFQAAYNAMSTFYGSGVSSDRADVVVLMTDGAPNGFTADWSTQVKSTSTCAAASAGGLIGYVARQTPHIEGIYKTTPNTSAQSANMGGAVVLSSTNGNCKMTTIGTRSWNGDFTLVPTNDAYGDRLVNSPTTYIPNVSAQVTVVDDPVDNSAAEAQFLAISKNAIDGAATRLRTDTHLRTTIYTVGLGGNPGTVYDDLDLTLLQRMANAPGSASFDPNQPAGKYFPVTDASYLSSAFAAVASEIAARLSK